MFRFQSGGSYNGKDVPVVPVCQMSVQLVFLLL